MYTVCVEIIGLYIFANNSLSILDTPLKSEVLGRKLSHVRYLGTKFNSLGQNFFVWCLYKGLLLFCVISTTVPYLKSAPKLCWYIFANNSFSVLVMSMKSKGLGKELSQVFGEKI
jgi:hypothetical protein